MKKILNIAILLPFLYGNLAYSQKWIPLEKFTENKTGFSTSVIESNKNIYKLKVKVSGYYDNPILEDGIVYHRPLFNNGNSESCLSIVGEPQLPTIVQRVCIPKGAQFKVSITETNWKDTDTGIIYPAQAHRLESEPVPSFQMSDSIYNLDLYSPTLLCVSPEQSWRSIRNVCIEICPFKYYPQQKKLSVLTEFVLQVDFTDVPKDYIVDIEDIQSAAQWGLFDNNTDSYVAEATDKKSSARETNDYDFLIVVGNNSEILSNTQTLQQFQKWKAFKGYKTKMVTTQETGTTQSSIKAYIAQEYTNYNIRYVLFVGDYDKIPLASILSPADSLTVVKGDYWYGCLAGDDYEADVSIGRFSTNSLAELQNMVEKTIAYESNYHGDYQETLLVAHKEHAPHGNQGCCDSIINSSYATSLWFTTAYGASTQWGGDEALNGQVINYINSGKHLVNYRGHGGYDRWGSWNVANESFTNDEVEQLDSCSIFLNIACLTGDITQEPCLMEKLTRSENAAVACLAATGISNGFANDEYDKNLFLKLLNNDVWHIGYLNVQAHMATFIPSFYYWPMHNACIYLCGGDPTLEIWTGTPQSFGNVNIERDGTDIIVSTSVYSDFTLSVVSDNGVLIETIGTAGSSCVFTPPTCNFYIVLNKHNYYPYVICCSGNGYVQNETLANNVLYVNTPLNIGYDVTNSVPYGNVVISTGTKVEILNGTGGVTIKNGFECEQGAELIIR